MRRIVIGAGVLVLTGVLVASVGATTTATAKRIAGTAKADNLKGTKGADTILGRAGNDKLYGLEGNDTLDGGPGDDKLVGGPGKDRYRCGAGSDTVVADSSDFRPGADCENVIAPQPALSIADATAPEGNAPSTMSFQVSLSFAAFKPVSVNYVTANGTATTPSDFVATSGTLTFAPGEVSKTVGISVLGDTVREPDETFTVSLSIAAGAKIADGAATGTITNDDVGAKPGHYHGPIGSGGFVDFDVSADSTTVSGVVIAAFMNCNPSSESGIYIFRKPSTSPIQPDLSFDAGGSGTGVSVTLVGKFEGDGSQAAGTIQITLTRDDGVTCDTGSSTWTAVWRS